jgi:hypothetical protein
MPPRWMTGTIFLLWLFTLGWMFQRDILPRFQTGEAPPFFIDLPDEVGANTVSWSVLQNGNRVGAGKSWVRARPDQTFELHSDFRFTNLDLLGVMDFQKIVSMYRVTKNGQLRELKAEVQLDVAKIMGAGSSGDAAVATLSGSIVEGYLYPTCEIQFGKGLEYRNNQFIFHKLGPKLPVPLTDKVPVPQKLLNPMHLVNKVKGLRENQTWEESLLDPPASVVPGHGLTIPRLVASVHADTLVWNDEETRCYRIDYQEPGKSVTARTWVRRYDGLVLQQEASHMGKEIVLQRDVNQ